MTRPLQPYQQQPTRTIVGCYTRFSNEDLQTEASLDSQVHECKDASIQKVWTFDQSLIFSDAGLSGETLETRPGLTNLLTIVESGHAPFSGIVVDDTNRLGRRVSDVLRICEIFKFHDVFLYFVNPQLDSRDPQFERLIIEYASEDQQFLNKLRHAVRRGQKDRARKGMNPGGFRYGYTSEIVPDPNRRGTIARPAIRGTKILILEEEAAVVRQMFLWGSEGISFKKIATLCINAKYPPPGRRFGVGTWTHGNVGTILRNPIYKGRLEWGRTRQAKHPSTGKSVAKAVPVEDWTIEIRPELAIVSSKLWDQAQAAIATGQRFGRSQLGGMAKRSGDIVPLLIGLLTCGACGGPLVVCSSSRKYGRILKCKNYWLKKHCSNAYSIFEPQLEEAVLQKIIQEISDPALIEPLLADFYRKLIEAIEQQIRDAQKKNRSTKNSDTQAHKLDTSIKNIVRALSNYGPSKPLLDELASLEEKKSFLQKQSIIVVPDSKIASFEDAREFFLQETQNLASVLRTNRPATREALREDVPAIVESLAAVQPDSERIGLRTLKGEPP